MNKTTLLYIVLFLAFVFACCKKHATNVTCTDAPIFVWGMGFPLPDTLVDVIKYKQDNAFDSVIDSVRISNFAFDTVFFPSLQNLTLVPGYDFRIMLRGTGNKFLLSNIRYGSHFHEDMYPGTGNTCYNPVISYTLNDSNIVVTDTIRTHAAYRLYLYP